MTRAIDTLPSVTVRIVLHVGPMKTGTSALAAALAAAQRRGSLPPGVVYPVDELWIEREGRITKHGEIKDLAPLVVPHHLRPLGLGSTPAQVGEALDRLMRTVRRQAAGDPATVILIAETAGRAADAPAIVTALREHADEVVLVLGVREPRAAAASVIGQGVRTWDRVSEHSLSARRVLTGPLRGAEHDYARLLERWTAAHPAVPVLLLPYLEEERGSGALMQRFGELIGVGSLDAPPATARGQLVHPGLARDDLRRLARLKRWAVLLGWMPGVRQRIQRQFAEVAKEASRRARPTSARRFTLSARDARWVLDRARPSIAAVRQHLGAKADEPAWRQWFAQLEVGPGTR